MNANAIKVLIADDEVIIRRGLRSTVPWEKYNMEVVADAPNGARGWEAFLEHRPELIITDIVMPEMNGIEFARKVKEQAPQTKILLLSCHRDFDYAQQGIKLGASGYLLKTAFNDEELEEYLEGFRREIESVTHEAQQQGQGSGGASAGRSSAAARRDALLLEWLFGLSDAFVAELRQWLAGEWSWMNEPVHMTLVTHSGLGQAERPGSGTAAIGSGLTVSSMGAGASGRKGGGGADAASCTTASASPAATPVAGQALLERLRGLFVSGGDCRLEAIPIGDDRCLLVSTAPCKAKLDAELLELKASHPKLAWSSHGFVDGIEPWLETARKLHRQAELQKTYDLQLHDWPQPIAIAVQKIVGNVHLSLCVSDVAREVGLSRSHFSTLFRKTVGQSFISYAYTMKLKVASQLLSTTQLTIQDISDKVGMPDAKYFSKWFKRCTGETPSQFRQRKRQASANASPHGA